MLFLEPSSKPFNIRPLCEIINPILEDRSIMLGRRNKFSAQTELTGTREKHCAVTRLWREDDPLQRAVDQCPIDMAWLGANGVIHTDFSGRMHLSRVHRKDKNVSALQKVENCCPLIVCFFFVVELIVRINLALCRLAAPTSDHVTSLTCCHWTAQLQWHNRKKQR